ncbi:lysylphosphatidylglycerol synthase domain-containing protein [Cellulomonas telluris]|uniref:lysylphosphatidylglycerol synthase domain-containing protein n=1 Tax=Cellulomonas telluris TaxID=2306636 RepID=UPI0010A885CF|nr:lysylphosphatidylglycerol synthase domain-containing protein [Cellulomonas telluris]
MTDDLRGSGTRTGSRRRWLRRSLEAAFYLLIVAFLVVYVQATDLSALADVQPLWWCAVVATVLALAFRYWGAFIWTVLLRSLGARGVRLDRELAYVYAKSWLGRYIPGTAPWILGKIWFASQHGVPRRKLAVSSLLEASLQILAQLIFAIALLLVVPQADSVAPGLRVLLVVALVACVAVLPPPVFNRVLRLAFRLLRRPPLDPGSEATWRTVGVGSGLYAVGAVMGGASLFFVAKTVDPGLGFDQVGYVVGVSTLAGAASMLAVFAPGGIGVREGIQIALLSLVMSPALALLVAVATRLHSVLIDLLFFAATAVSRSAGRRRQRVAAPDAAR